MGPKRKIGGDDDEYVDDDDTSYDDHIIRGNSKKRGKDVRKGRPVPQSHMALIPRTTMSNTKGVLSTLNKSHQHTLYDSNDNEIQFQDFSSSLTLRPDHRNRPIWVSPDSLIYLEAFNPKYHVAYDFLVAIGEPVSRPKFIHTYRLTEDSLYAAVALSIDTELIIKVLGYLCKTELPQEVATYIRQCTYTFGKAKLVLKENQFYIESLYPEVLRELLKNPTIRDARLMVQAGQGESTAAADTTTNNNSSSTGDNGTSHGTSSSAAAGRMGGSTTTTSIVAASASTAVTTSSSSGDHQFLESTVQDEDRRNLQYMIDLENEEEEEDIMNASANFGRKTVSFMVKQEDVQNVKRSAKADSRYPLMEEYDFKNDKRNPNLTLDLKPSTRIRSYQEKSLSKMFGNGRARSGIIVLPCGAGKSLTGVTAASTIKKNTMVVCINNASVFQWRDEFLNWTTVSKEDIKVFTSKEKDQLPVWNKKNTKNRACICISTYSMLCHGGKRSASGEIMVKAVREREWGCMILDEVHVAPAEIFQKVLSLVNAHCKLGLTATLVREDNRIKDLHFLVGPKLYEANWIDLTDLGFLARVQCVEVWCPMTKEFYSEYVKGQIDGSSNNRIQRLLYIMNPNKIKICEYLLRHHVAAGDKIIIFSDDVCALILYCEALSQVYEIPYIFGPTPEKDRREWLHIFKTSPNMPILGLSKVGDTALDIPEANVIIQVSSQFGARRQEAQRLGRILRPKKHNIVSRGGYNAFFYSLVSSDTREMYFSTKRQQYLIDQGYTFKVLQNLAPTAIAQSTLLKTKTDEVNLLQEVLKFDFNDVDADEERALTKVNGDDIEDDEGSGKASKYLYKSSGGNGGGSAEKINASGTIRRTSSTLSSKSGLDGKVYSEWTEK